MALGYTLEDMQALLVKTIDQTKIFSSAIATIDEAINKLSSSWVSNEIGTYQQFVDKYNEKRGSLADAVDYMERFCNKLSEKIKQFDDAGTAVKNTFE